MQHFYGANENENPSKRQKLFHGNQEISMHLEPQKLEIPIPEE